MDYHEIRDKEDLLSRYAADHPRLKGILPDEHGELIDFVPDISGAWTMREHIAHLADVEVRTFIRYRSSILASGIGLVLGGGDVEASNGCLNYSCQKVEDSLEVIRLLRKMTIEHVSGMSDDAMESYCIEHQEFGAINLKMILSIATQHVGIHIEYLLRNIALFNEKTMRVLGEFPPKKGAPQWKSSPAGGKRIAR